MTKAPFELQRLDHLVLRTRDVERLVSFYERLGCSVVRRIDAMNMAQLAAGGSMIDIVEAPDGATPGDGANLDHFALRVDPFDRDAILGFCAELGVPAQAMEQPLLGADGFGPAVYTEDPDGNRVELKGPPERPRPDQD